jgi:hypothetical protein
MGECHENFFFLKKGKYCWIQATELYYKKILCKGAQHLKPQT